MPARLLRLIRRDERPDLFKIQISSESHRRSARYISVRAIVPQDAHSNACVEGRLKYEQATMTI